MFSLVFYAASILTDGKLESKGRPSDKKTRNNVYPGAGLY